VIIDNVLQRGTMCTMAKRKLLTQEEIKSRLPTPMQIVPVRIPTALTKRLDSYADRLRREQPGLRVTRSDVIRLLCERGLDAVEEKGAGRG
jgi:hypothetical protein